MGIFSSQITKIYLFFLKVTPFSKAQERCPQVYFLGKNVPPSFLLANLNNPLYAHLFVSFSTERTTSQAKRVGPNSQTFIKHYLLIEYNKLWNWKTKNKQSCDSNM